MADDDLEPPSPLASRLFAAEKKRPASVDDATSGRVLARVTATVVAGAALGTATAAKAAASAGSSAATSAGSIASGSASATASATTAGAASLGLTAKALPWVIAAFVAGGGTGAAIHASFTPSAPVPTVASVTPSVVTTTIAPPASTSASPPAITPQDLPSVAPAVAPRPSATTASSSSPDVELAAERALVDRARSALSAGQPAAAIDAVDAHATRFPRGRLAEEREALAVQALARSGNTSGAKRRADAFRKAYPNSIFGPAVDLAAP